MLNQGDHVTINATVLRVDGDRVDMQTPDGQLIQTDASNIAEALEMPKMPIVIAGGAIEHDAKEASKGKTAGGSKGR